MKKRSLYPYFALAALIFALWNMPNSYANSIRAWSASISAPFWNWFNKLKSDSYTDTHANEIALLRMENGHLKMLVQQELALLEQMASLQSYQPLKEAAERHCAILQNALKNQLEGIPARVLYRSPAAWNSSLWLNVGTYNNDEFGYTIIAHNSPVLKDGALVGIVDYVGLHQCRVRLLSDTGLCPSVRCVRGAWRDHWLAQQVNMLQRQLSQREDLLSPAKKEIILNELSALKQILKEPSESWLLAKGELQGGSHPLWRLPGKALKGIGFNYEFADEEGSPRDLRTGIPNGQISSEGAVPLLKVKDLLITTGYDGVFPAGLPVAEVTKISPLGEGDYYYELEAEPCAGSLVDIDDVLVLPPVGFNSHDQPPSTIW